MAAAAFTSVLEEAAVAIVFGTFSVVVAETWIRSTSTCNSSAITGCVANFLRVKKLPLTRHTYPT
ncbi:hypothetical protein, partial [Ruegeria lacuscaerulensis]|uniref:hypothetical protein n=1 Tax=Ruegeria lacuscaerulensis TaxID=55218 RepID=UPI001F214E8E